MTIFAPIDRAPLWRAYLADEETCVAERLDQARMHADTAAKAAQLAGDLVMKVRQHHPGGIDAFMKTYDLSSDEGVALMCLAEALLRIPDARTADDLIRDKLVGPDWRDRLDKASPVFVNAASFSLMLTGRILDRRDDAAGRWWSVVSAAARRMGEPVIRVAVRQAMAILGGQFVFGRTIEEALKRTTDEPSPGTTHSFDMLGEAARTFEDAQRYRQSYAHAIDAIAASASAGVAGSPGISIKLSALYPRYEFLHAEQAKAAILPILLDLAARASRADISFTVDAEEADRLDLSMDLIEDVVASDPLFANGWTGFGLALQAYQKRAVPLTDWVIALARCHRRRLMVRLVKGAYWDTEIKQAQVAGLPDYPVFTRKAATDVSYLACAQSLLAAPDAVYPAFATHNANTVAAIRSLAQDIPFEFQRLHGMGEELYGELAAVERALWGRSTPVRVYAPVGQHEELLAYLVRRLLENGANSSFVNRIADDAIPVGALIRDPVDELAALQPRRNPAIALPADLFAPSRRNSSGVDLGDPAVREPLMAALAQRATIQWSAAPPAATGTAPPRSVTAPFDRQHRVGEVRDAVQADIDTGVAAARAAQPAWCALGGDKRATCLEAAADLLEARRDDLFSLCIREAGKTLPDAILEIREAVDFLRYYATEARRQFCEPLALAGPTGERNQLRLVGRGVFAAISPWNFPLAIFIGPVAAALAAGNAVIAKPAQQTPLIAALAIELLHQAGVPDAVVQLLPGDGTIGAALVVHPGIAGVAFTGSTATARSINRALAQRDGAIIPFIAETGGQNAMIVDSSALPEQVTRDVIASAFQSAGQRCSALRVLFVQDDVADTMLDMIIGAMRALVVGDPRNLDTDVGPVIDDAAKAALEAHAAQLERNAKPLFRLALPDAAAQGSFVAPALYEIGSIDLLDREHFGPILHVVRFRSGDLPSVVDAINAVGYGLTLGLHSRIGATHAFVESHARVGNLYINRNQIGAVVGSQPFGGEGLSGTGPKAGGPHYVARFATERVTCTDTTAAGGNASLMAAG